MSEPDRTWYAADVPALEKVWLAAYDRAHQDITRVERQLEGRRKASLEKYATDESGRPLVKPPSKTISIGTFPLR